MTTEKKQQYFAYIEKLEQMGKKVVSYECPACNGEVKTQAAPEDETWDTLSACPHCDGLHMKWTQGSVAGAAIVDL